MMLPKDHIITSSGTTGKATWMVCACGKTFIALKHRRGYITLRLEDRLRTVARDFKEHREHEFFKLESVS